MKRISKRPLNFFDGMQVGDEVDVIDVNNQRRVFVKNTYDTGEIHSYNNGEKTDEQPFEHNFKEFPSDEDAFIQRVKYIMLRDMGAGENSTTESQASARQLQNEDLKDTYLQLVPAPGINLGHDIYVKNVTEQEAVRDMVEYRRSSGTNEELLNRMSGATGSEVFPQVDGENRNIYLPDFIYSYKMKVDDKMVAFDSPVVISYSFADEIYDINSPSELKDFFIERLEDQIDAPIEKISELIRKSMNLPPEGEAETDEIGVGDVVSLKDFFEIYESKKDQLQPKSPEMKALDVAANKIIKSIRDGEQFTTQDIHDYLEFSEEDNNEEIVVMEDYRTQVEMAQLEKEINKFEFEAEKHLEQMDMHQGQSFEIRQNFHDAMDNILELQEEFESSLNEMGKGQRRKELLTEIRRIIQQAKDLIKK